MVVEEVREYLELLEQYPNIIEMQLEKPGFKMRVKKERGFHAPQNAIGVHTTEYCNQREQSIRAPRIGRFKFAESIRKKLIKIQREGVITVASRNGNSDYLVVPDGCIIIEQGEYLGSISQLKVPFWLPDPSDRSFFLKEIYIKVWEDSGVVEGWPVEYNEILFTVVYN